mgnify:CR=1 FL=1
MSHLEATSLACPRCAPRAQAVGAPPTPLFRNEGGGVALHGCAACGGVFLARACADRLATQLPVDAIGIAERTSRAARYTPDHATLLACPMCKRAMNRVRAAAAGIELDTCASCGTWYDRDEIGRITDTIRKSGWGTAAVAGGAAVVAAGAAAGVAAGAATAASRQPMAQQAAEGAAEVGAEVVVDAVVTGIDAADVLGGVFEILGAFFD